MKVNAVFKKLHDSEDLSVEVEGIPELSPSVPRSWLNYLTNKLRKKVVPERGIEPPRLSRPKREDSAIRH